MTQIIDAPKLGHCEQSVSSTACLSVHRKKTRGSAALYCRCRLVAECNRTTSRITLWKYELAFGHHRIEAARRSVMKSIPLIVEELTDTQMLQYMGRENLEDYNAAFLIQLESWEAASKSGLVLSAKADREPQPIEIAKTLGWTVIKEQEGRPPNNVMNDTARACAAAYALIQGGYNTRDDFVSLDVRAARDLVERGFSRIEQIEKAGRKGATPAWK